MHADCHEGMGGFGNGAGNDTEPDDADKPIGALVVILGVGGAKFVGCLGTGGAGHCGGWSNVGVKAIAGAAEATDDALLVVPQDWSTDITRIENTADDPGVVKLVVLAAAEDEAGALVAADVRERERAARAEWSLKCSGTVAGDQDKNHDHSDANSINHLMPALKGNFAKSQVGCASSRSLDFCYAGPWREPCRGESSRSSICRTGRTSTWRGRRLVECL